MLEVFRRLGSIQFDPLAVAGRTHDLVLHARVADYDPAWCDLLYERREIFEAYNKGLSLRPGERVPVVPRDVEPERAARPRRERRGGRAGARADPRRGAAVVARLRARARADDRLVRDADEHRSRRARGVLRHRRARARATRRQPPLLRPPRAAAAGRRARAGASRSRSSSGTSSSRATARTACSASAAAETSSAASARPSRIRGGRSIRAGRRCARSSSPTASSFPSRSRACAASASCSRRRSDCWRAAGAAALRRVPAAVRPVGLGPGPPRIPVRVRLRVGALPPAGQAALGLVRAADALPRPPRRPDRAAHRPRRRPGAGARPLVGGRLRAAPHRGLRRRDARRAPRLPALRRRDPPRVGAAPRDGETAVSHALDPRGDNARSRAARSNGPPCVASTCSTGSSSSGRSPSAISSRVTPGGATSR